MVARDIIIMCGVGAVYLVLGEVEFSPTMISKLNTVLQIGLIFSLLFQLSYHQLANQVIQFFMIAVLITSLFSLVDYVYSWSKKAYLEKHST